MTNIIFDVIIKANLSKGMIVMYKKSITHQISKVVIDILFYFSILCVVLVPVWGKDLFSWINYSNINYLIPFMVIIFLSGLCCVYILYNLKQMFRSLLVGNPFIDKNVKHLRKIAVTCSIIAMMYVIKCFFMFTFATLVIAIVFVVGCLFCLTLKDLFKQAINYKTEMELTI